MKDSFRGRGGHRTRSHNAAHVDGKEPGSPVPAMDLVHRGEPSLVETNEQLALLIGKLRIDGSFAYDSEFIGELSYHPRLCLVQVASQSCLALIDPLAGLDLTPFWELLADPAVNKIVHAGESDVEPVVRHLQRPAANVLDTQIGAAFIGLPYPISLNKLVFQLTGVTLGRDLGFSNWDQRPLSPVQLRYAIDDVRYLPAAGSELLRRLDALGRLSWVEEECASACAIELFRFNPQTQFLRVRGGASLPPRGQAVLRELTTWRDAAARRHDKPPRAFLKDEVMVDLAANPPRSAADLAKIRSLPRSVEHEHGADIVHAATRAMSLPAADLPKPPAPELTAAEKFRSDALFGVMQCMCTGLSLDPALVASRKELERFYRFVAGDDTGELPALLCGWRRTGIGEWLSAFLRGESAIGMRWDKGTLRAMRLD